MAPGRCFHTLYTVGYAGFTIDSFVALLSSLGVGVVCDVRSAPYSRRHPAYSSRALRARLVAEGIPYLFLGRELSARRTEQEAYTEDRVDFAKVRELEAFRAGLRRVLELLAAAPVAILCAEKDPIGCHRLILVARALKVEAGVEILHRWEDGRIETQASVERRLLALHGPGQGELCGAPEDPLARAYRRQGQAIAYVRRRSA